jgi:thioredoxin
MQMMTRTLIIQLVVGLLIGGAMGAVLGRLGKCSTGTCPLTANPYRGAFVGALLGGMLVFSGGASRGNPEGKEEGYSAIHIDSADDFQKHVVNADKPVLVDFYLDTCPPCRQLAPTVEVLAEEYEGRAIVCKINAAEVPDVARQYGVQGVPAVLFFSGGQVVQRFVGLMPKKTYTEVLDSLTK